MTYSRKDILTSISFLVFIFSFAIVFTLFFKPLYYFDINHLDLVEKTGYTLKQIKDNYQILINYQSIFYQGELVFKDFIMSTNGRIHFIEVKRIFEIIQIICLISTITTSILITYQLKHHEYRFFKLTSKLTIIIPLIVLLLVLIDFEHIFILFHKICFNNDYWIFNTYTDPIINILPEAFFMHAVILIIFVIMLFSLITKLIYNYYEKKVLKIIDYHK